VPELPVLFHFSSIKAILKTGPNTNPYLNPKLEPLDTARRLPVKTSPSQNVPKPKCPLIKTKPKPGPNPNRNPDPNSNS